MLIWLIRSQPGVGIDFLPFLTICKLDLVVFVYAVVFGRYASLQPNCSHIINQMIFFLSIVKWMSAENLGIDTNISENKQTDKRQNDPKKKLREERGRKREKSIKTGKTHCNRSWCINWHQDFYQQIWSIHVRMNHFLRGEPLIFA